MRRPAFTVLSHFWEGDKVLLPRPFDRRVGCYRTPRLSNCPSAGRSPLRGVAHWANASLRCQPPPTGGVGSASFGTVGEWAASGRFAEGENEPEVARFTSAGCGSALRADEVGGIGGLRSPCPGSLIGAWAAVAARACQTAHLRGARRCAALPTGQALPFDANRPLWVGTDGG